MYRIILAEISTSNDRPTGNVKITTEPEPMEYRRKFMRSDGNRYIVEKSELTSDYYQRIGL